MYCAFAGGYDIYFGHKKIIETCLKSSSGVSCIQSDSQSLISTSFFLPSASGQSQSITTVQTLSKTVICNVYISLLTKGLLFKHKHTSGLHTSQKASWYIYFAHAWKIMTVNMVLSVHLQACVKTLIPTDCKTLHINLLATKHSNVMSLMQQFLVRHRINIVESFRPSWFWSKEMSALKQVSHIRNISSKLAF